jgi:hypothetical protein
MNEFGAYEPTPNEQVDETPIVEVKEGYVEAFGRKLINDAKLCSSVLRHVEGHPGEEIERVTYNKELKDMIKEYGSPEHFYSTAGRVHEAIEKINVSKEKIQTFIRTAKKKSEETGEQWENILTKSLFRLKSLNGEVSVVQSDYYLSFVANDLQDYASMYQNGVEKPLELAGYTGQQDSVPFVVLRGDLTAEQNEATHSHEEQHVFNLHLLERTEPSMLYTKGDLTLIAESGKTPTTEELESAIISSFNDVFALQTKNEILAYYRTKNAKEGLGERLADVNSLNYIDTVKEKEIAPYESTIFRHKMLPQGDLTKEEYKDMIFKFTTDAYEKSKSVIENWVKEAEKIFALLEKTEDRQDIIFMLSLVPIKKWGRIANIFEKIEKNKQEKNSSDDKELHDEEIEMATEMLIQKN